MLTLFIRLDRFLASWNMNTCIVVSKKHKQHLFAYKARHFIKLTNRNFVLSSFL